MTSSKHRRDGGPSSSFTLYIFCFFLSKIARENTTAMRTQWEPHAGTGSSDCVRTTVLRGFIDRSWLKKKKKKSAAPIVSQMETARAGTRIRTDQLYRGTAIVDALEETTG